MTKIKGPLEEFFMEPSITNDSLESSFVWIDGRRIYHSTVNPKIYLPVSQLVVFNYDRDGIRFAGKKSMSITLVGSEIFAQAYIFGLCFLYSNGLSDLERYLNPPIQGLIRTGGSREDFRFAYAMYVEDAIRDHPLKRYVIQLLDDDEQDPYFVLTNNISATAGGLTSVSLDLEIRKYQDVDFRECQFIDLWDPETNQTTDFDRLFRMGSTWDAVTREGGYPIKKLKDVQPEPETEVKGMLPLK